jgi:hypothetical protein
MVTFDFFSLKTWGLLHKIFPKKPFLHFILDFFFAHPNTPNYPQEYLAKFGYKPDMKVYIKKNPFMFWLQAITSCKKNPIIIYIFSNFG